MRVFWLFAHPEARSLSASLREVGLAELRALGHSYVESDLYAMGFDPVVRAADYAHDPGERLHVDRASLRAYRDGTLSADIRAEQEKLAWADTVIVQFPLWWYGMPAILKGWFDRVFVRGFGYGVSDPEVPGRTLRYGDGVLTGKRAMVLLGTGGPADTFGPRGINGQLDEVLFGLQHGTLFYTGMQVVPPLVLHGANRLSDECFSSAGKELRERLRELPDTEPIPFRRQNGGDYDEHLVLRPELAPGRTGLSVHRDAPPPGGNT